MHFSEDDLRVALQRKDPGEAFTQRVMARVDQGETETTLPGLRWWSLRFRPLFAGELAAAAVAVASWVGIQQYQSRQRAEGERAKEQAILALRIAHAKLNQVFERVRATSFDDQKIRREHL